MKKALLISTSIILAFIFIFLIWSINPLKPLKEVENYLKPDKNVEIEYIGKDIFFKTKTNSNIGIIFYPGGHVDYRAYTPPGFYLAKNNINFVLLKMPLNLAFFRTNGAKSIIDKYGNIKRYVAGHSLGGIAAIEFAKKNNVEGVILLASYPSKDISNLDLKILAITASKDGLVTREKFKSKIKFFPKNTVFYEIDGGNHSQFGFYPLQKGNNKATIDRYKQLSTIVNKILEFINENSSLN
ncbi:alpha/beta hydrolase [Thermosipho globiformans]|uniref:alpha/beta hydrolase n=1 Tax=Thermosipho globiformans TaxID=380685 RepID=UPI000F8D2883|nr:alpha/beta hydrolase [Thermosipho globiformans]